MKSISTKKYNEKQKTRIVRQFVKTHKELGVRQDETAEAAGIGHATLTRASMMVNSGKFRNFQNNVIEKMEAFVKEFRQKKETDPAPEPAPQLEMNLTKESDPREGNIRYGQCPECGFLDHFKYNDNARVLCKECSAWYFHKDDTPINEAMPAAVLKAMDNMSSGRTPTKQEEVPEKASHVYRKANTDMQEQINNAYAEITRLKEVVDGLNNLTDDLIEERNAAMELAENLDLQKVVEEQAAQISLLVKIIRNVDV